MTTATVLYSENSYPDDSVERRIYGPDVRVIFPKASASLADLSDADCAAAEGLMILRFKVNATDLKRFPRLRAICRMGVGYDNLDRVAAADRQITILNVPDYGTTEVADHAMALALSLRRGLLIHLEAQRATPPAIWRYIDDPLVRRSSVQTFGIIGMGRIATAVALRAKAFGFRVVFLRSASAQRCRTRPRRAARSNIAGVAQSDRYVVRSYPADARNPWPAGAEGTFFAAQGCDRGQHSARSDRGHRCFGDTAEKRPSGRGRLGRCAG